MTSRPEGEVRARRNRRRLLRVDRVPRSTSRMTAAGRRVKECSYCQSDHSSPSAESAARCPQFFYRLVPPPLGLERTGLVASGCVESVGPLAPG